MTLQVTHLVANLRYSVDDDERRLWYTVARLNVADEWEITDSRHRPVLNEGRLGKRILQAVAARQDYEKELRARVEPVLERVLSQFKL